MKKISKAQIERIKAAKARKREAKNNAAEQKKNQKYSLMAMFNDKIVNKVKEILKKNDVKTKIATDTYFFMSDITASEAKSIFTMFDDCKVTTGDGSKKKEHHVVFQLHKTGETKTVNAKKHKKSRPGAHSTTPKKERTKFKKSETPRVHKRRSIVNRGKHNSGKAMSSTQRKLSSRIKKATNAIEKKETRTRSTNVIHKTIVRAKQLKFDFKEAA